MFVDEQFEDFLQRWENIILQWSCTWGVSAAISLAEWKWNSVIKGEYLVRNTTNSEQMVYSAIWNYMFRPLLTIFRFLQFFKSSLYML